MRILIVNYEYPPLGGGGGVVTRSLVRSLSSAHELVVLTSRGPGLPSDSVEDGARVIRVAVAGRSDLQRAAASSLATFVPSAIRSGRRLLREWRPDLVHTFFAIPTGPAGLSLARAAGVPHVLSFMGADVHDPTRRLGPDRFGPLGAVVRRTARGSDALVAVSADLAERAARIVGTSDIHVVPNASEESDLPARDRAALGWNDDEVVVVTVARLVGRKALHTLVNAVGMLPRSVRLEIVGDGPEQISLAELARGVSNTVVFAGALSTYERDLRLVSADIFALPSLHEAFGVATLEAMRAGLPVVATDSGGPRDFVRDGETGYLVPALDVPALADRIRRLADDPDLRKRMGGAGRSRAAEFTSARMAERYLAIYEETLAGGPSSRSNLREQTAFYRERARRFDTTIWSLGCRDNRNHERKIGAIADSVGARSAEKVLEVGAGTGLHGAWILERMDAAYTGLDLSEDMLKIARDRLARFGPRARLLAGDAQRLPFPDGWFDAAFCAGTLHHLAHPEQGLHELARVVRRGGRVAALEPNWKFPSVLVYSAATREEWNTFKVNERSLRDWAERAGLRDVSVVNLLYTPPRPRPWSRLFDRIDDALAQTPFIRHLSIVMLVSGRRG